MRYPHIFLTAMLLVGCIVTPAVGADDEEELDAIGHTADGYYLDFLPFAKIELPRLFLTRAEDGTIGFEVFRSTSAALQSGRYIVSTDDPDISRLALDELIEGGSHLYLGVRPTTGSVIVDFSITRHLVFGILAAILLLVAFIRLARRYQQGIGRTTAPKGVWQNMLEAVIVFIRDEIARPNIGEKYERYMPYLLTVFFFILVCNLFGMVPFGATATANITVTATLAMCTFVITQFSGSRDYWLHILWPPGMPVFVKLILIPVEILGIFSKPIALAIRLFAVMTAGHLVILSLIGLIFTFAVLFSNAIAWSVAPVSVAMALFVSFLELLIALIQAYIFTILSALFIGMAAAQHHEDEEHAGEVERHFEAETAPSQTSGEEDEATTPVGAPALTT